MQCDEGIGSELGGGHAQSARGAQCGRLLDTTRCTSMPYDATTKAAPKGRAKPGHATVPEREYRWEGFLKGESGPAQRLRFEIACRLSFLAGRVIGSGQSADLPYDTDPAARQFTLNGERAGDHLMLTLRFTAGRVSELPFQLNGRIDAEQGFISGSWTWKCPKCTCGGTSGHFELQRVERS